MELSEAVVEGLKVAGSSSLSDQLFHSLLSRAVEVSPTSSRSDEGMSQPVLTACNSESLCLNADVDYHVLP